MVSRVWQLPGSWGRGQATEPPCLGGRASEAASYLPPRRVVRINIVSDLNLYQ